MTTLKKVSNLEAATLLKVTFLVIQCYLIRSLSKEKNNVVQKQHFNRLFPTKLFSQIHIDDYIEIDRHIAHKYRMEESVFGMKKEHAIIVQKLKKLSYKNTNKIYENICNYKVQFIYLIR